MIRPSLLAWFLLAAVAVAARPDDSCEGLPVLIDEHFQALQEACTVKGFRAYGGKWRVEGGVLHAPAGPGFKLVADEAPLENGEIGVEVLLPAAGPGNAGLIVKLSEPGTASP